MIILLKCRLGCSDLHCNPDLEIMDSTQGPKPRFWDTNTERSAKYLLFWVRAPGGYIIKFGLQGAQQDTNVKPLVQH